MPKTQSKTSKKIPAKKTGNKKPQLTELQAEFQAALLSLNEEQAVVDSQHADVVASMAFISVVRNMAAGIQVLVTIDPLRAMKMSGFLTQFILENAQRHLGDLCDLSVKFVEWLDEIEEDIETAEDSLENLDG